MKKSIIAIALALALMVSLVPTTVFADKPQGDDGYNGNGAPSGQHMNINLIGVSNPKGWDYDSQPGGNGGTIFVKDSGTTRFYVEGGSSFAILDHDGTDGVVGLNGTATIGGTGTAGTPGIIFPYDANSDPTWRVQIWVRLLGPQGSAVNFKSYYYDTVGTTYVYWDEFALSKDGQTKFTEKTGALLADGYKDMLWDMTPGDIFKHCQMRIFLLDD